MAQHNDFGKLAEVKAAEFLQKKGYKILNRNWRFQKLEIDIIAHDLEKDQIVIVEVKARKDSTIQPAEDAVNKTKRKMLVTAAHEYIVSHSIEKETRFDIVSVYKSQNQWVFRHIPNAFLAMD